MIVVSDASPLIAGFRISDALSIEGSWLTNKKLLRTLVNGERLMGNG